MTDYYEILKKRLESKVANTIEIRERSCDGCQKCVNHQSPTLEREKVFSRKYRIAAQVDMPLSIAEILARIQIKQEEEQK